MKKFLDKLATITMTAFLTWGILSWLDVVIHNTTTAKLAVWNLFVIFFG